MTDHYTEETGMNSNTAPRKRDTAPAYTPTAATYRLPEAARILMLSRCIRDTEDGLDMKHSTG